VCFAEAVSGTEFDLIGPDGKLAAQLGMAKEGAPCLWLMDNQGRARLNLCLYPENGFAPGVVLMDEKGEAAGLFRLAGIHQSPVLVFKSNGGDRMMMGLDINEPAQDPFLTIVGQAGNKLTSLGQENGKSGDSSGRFLTGLIALAAGFVGGWLSPKRS